MKHDIVVISVHKTWESPSLKSFSFRKKQKILNTIYSIFCFIFRPNVIQFCFAMFQIDQIINKFSGRPCKYTIYWILKAVQKSTILWTDVCSYRTMSDSLPQPDPLLSLALFYPWSFSGPPEKCNERLKDPVYYVRPLLVLNLLIRNLPLASSNTVLNDTLNIHMRRLNINIRTL